MKISFFSAFWSNNNHERLRNVKFSSEKINDLVDFSEGIYWILKEKGRTEKMGLEGRKNVIKNFSYKRVAQLYVNLYQKLALSEHMN